MPNLLFSFLTMAVTIASTDSTYPQRDGQAELSRAACYTVRRFTCLNAPLLTGLNKSNFVDQKFSQLLPKTAMGKHQMLNMRERDLDSCAATDL